MPTMTTKKLTTLKIAKRYYHTVTIGTPSPVIGLSSQIRFAAPGEKGRARKRDLKTLQAQRL